MSGKRGEHTIESEAIRLDQDVWKLVETEARRT